MCGIHFAICTARPVRPDDAVVQLLKSRGPDSFQQQEVIVNVRNDNCPSGEARQYHLSFSSSVLSLRGYHTAVQPFLDKETGSILCWNGEAWKIGDAKVSANDGEIVFNLLLRTAPSTARGRLSQDEVNSRIRNIIAAFDSIRGPYAFVHFDAPSGVVFFGRDCLGRRSLLTRTDAAGIVFISSVCTGTWEEGWHEIEADGIYAMDVSKCLSVQSALAGVCKSRNGVAGVQGPTTWHISRISQRPQNSDTTALVEPLPLFNRSQPASDFPRLDLQSPSVVALEQKLSDSTRLRVQNVPRPPAREIDFCQMKSTKIALLFSGGLDCTMLARLAHELLPVDEAIDLLNVAFENPRVVGAAKHTSTIGPTNIENPDPYGQCPDRITGIASHSELQQICPGRTWRFVSINIPYTETLQHRSQVISLMQPHNTEMDLSISYALYFAARGRGTVYNLDTNTTQQYTTPARVLLSGLGADELFGGYTRHATAFSRHGFVGLIDELELDIRRLGRRNLGRDDRVISHWGKEVRYPYLDESLLSCALACPVWEKCGFGQDALDIESSGEPRLEPGKKVLRLLAWKMGMKRVATEKKRAIQFGARTAKMEAGKIKGTQLLS